MVNCRYLNLSNTTHFHLPFLANDAIGFADVFQPFVDLS